MFDVAFGSNPLKDLKADMVKAFDDFNQARKALNIARRIFPKGKFYITNETSQRFDNDRKNVITTRTPYKVVVIDCYGV